MVFKLINVKKSINPSFVKKVTNIYTKRNTAELNAIMKIDTFRHYGL